MPFEGAAMYRYKPEDGSLLFKFDAEGSRIANGKAFDLSRWGNHATVLNGACLKSSPTGKPMFYFDGVDDCLVIPGSEKLSPIDITIAVWLENRDETTVGGLIGTTGYSSNRGIGIYRNSTDDFYKMWIGDGVKREITGRLCTIKKGFNHYIFTKKGKVITTMVNGKPTESSAFPTISTPYYLGHSWYIGQSIRADYNFYGPVNDARLYNRALSPAEGSRLYNETRRYYGK